MSSTTGCQSVLSKGVPSVMGKEVFFDREDPSEPVPAPKPIKKATLKKIQKAIAKIEAHLKRYHKQTNEPNPGIICSFWSDK